MRTPDITEPQSRRAADAPRLSSHQIFGHRCNQHEQRNDRNPSFHNLESPIAMVPLRTSTPIPEDLFEETTYVSEKHSKGRNDCSSACFGPDRLNNGRATAGAGSPRARAAAAATATGTHA